jgi:hypothetical protein
MDALSMVCLTERLWLVPEAGEQSRARPSVEASGPSDGACKHNDMEHYGAVKHTDRLAAFHQHNLLSLSVFGFCFTTLLHLPLHNDRRKVCTGWPAWD